MNPCGFVFKRGKMRIVADRDNLVIMNGKKEQDEYPRVRMGRAVDVVKGGPRAIPEWAFSLKTRIRS